MAEDTVYDPKEEGKARRALRKYLIRKYYLLCNFRAAPITTQYAIENENGHPVYGMLVTQGDIHPLTFEVTVYDHSCKVKGV